MNYEKEHVLFAQEFTFLWKSLPFSWCRMIPSALTFKVPLALPFTQLHIIEICCINFKIIPPNNHFCCFFQRYSNSSGNLSILYFSSASFNDCLYCYLKAHLISLPNIQFHGEMRKCCLSMLLLRFDNTSVCSLCCYCCRCIIALSLRPWPLI